MKKLLKAKIFVVLLFLSFFFFLIICILAIMGYTIGNDSVAQTSVILKKQSYLENNDLYAEKYRSTLNKLLFDYGYVSMERLVWYLQATNNIADPNTLSDDIWEKAYIENIDEDEKQMIPTSDMCEKVDSDFNDENFVDLCNPDYIAEHNLIYTNTYMNLPYIFPLKHDTLSSITSMVNEKRDIDLGLSDEEQESVNFHSGWDLSSSAETNVYSICDGTVTSVNFTQDENITFDEQTEPKNKVGNIIKIQCSSTNDIVTYAHLYPNSASENMVMGNFVSKGEFIAKVGTTGQSTGNHLHLEINSDSGIRLDAFYFIDFTENSIYKD